MKIINNLLNIKLGQFTQEELDIVLTKSKTEKLPVLMKYPKGMKDKEIWWHIALILQCSI